MNNVMYEPLPDRGFTSGDRKVSLRIPENKKRLPRAIHSVQEKSKLE
jgi:hypothetical protein